MAEEHTNTKIPRLDDIKSRIGKPSGFVRPNASSIPSSSRIAKPGFGIRNTKFGNENGTLSQSSQLQRKTLLRRLGDAANKFVNVGCSVTASTNEQQPLSQKSAINGQININNNSVPNEPVKRTLDVTKTIDTGDTMDRCLTRSSTFVCDTGDETQVKLLSVTHNIGTPTPPNEVNQKERTFKRSLSPIYGDSTNMAKRKSLQMVSSLDQSRAEPFLISTPRNNEQKYQFFPAKNSDGKKLETSAQQDLNTFTLDDTMHAFLPNSTKSNGVLSSTIHKNRLLDFTQTINSTVKSNDGENNLNEHVENQNITKLLCMTQMEGDGCDNDGTLIASDHEQDENIDKNNGKEIQIDTTRTLISEQSQPIPISSAPMTEDTIAKQRFSFGLDLTECTLDCSIELCDSSATSAQDISPMVNYKMQNSFEMDESLGILTPDQMIEFLDSTAANPNLELPLSLPIKLPLHKHRIDQTPSPEELPLDPIEIKTYVSNTSNDLLVDQEQLSQSDQMTKSNASKVPTSFITSVTSIASLDNGYQGDGEMSRPASRGGENSPLNVRRVLNDRRKKMGASLECGSNDNDNIPILRRQDPMTDSDFFTESDADDIFHRGDRRVQIIDGHLYNGQGADVFIDEPQQNDLSCMDSSGIYTDVDNRADDEPHSNRNDIDSDMSPDGSTDTIKSSEYVNQNKKQTAVVTSSLQTIQQQQQQHKKQIELSQAWLAPTQSTQSIVSDSTSSTINGTGYVCEKVGEKQCCVISDASISAVKTLSCTIATNSCNSNNNNNNNQNNSSVHTSNNDTPIVPTQLKKAKKSSPSRKQNKNETNVALKKYAEMSKRELKTFNGKVRNKSVLSSPTISIGTDSTDNISCNSNERIVHARKLAPNKWDEVMNKIAQNKAATDEKLHKKFSEVKSKVTSGLGVKRCSTIKRSSSDQTTASEGNGISSKPLLSLSRQTTCGVAKRTIERDNSKDSQVSSRDLSLSPSNSSKPLSPSSRSAKKRYERTLITTQNGFNPANKVDGTGDNLAIKPVALHKKYSPNNTIQSTNTTSSSPTEKRSTISAVKKIGPTTAATSATTAAATKRLTQTLTNKLSHAKENIQSAETTPQQQPLSSPSVQQTPINNKNGKNGINSPKLLLKVSNAEQPLIPANQRNGKSTTSPSSSSPTLNGVRKLQSNAKPKGTTINKKSHSSKPLTNGEIIVNCTSTAATVSATTVNDTIDHATVTAKTTENKLHTIDPHLIHANKGIAAFGVLIQHLAFNLHAFDLPELRTSYEKTKTILSETQINLDSMLTKCHFLEEQVVAKETFYTTREKELLDLHRHELDKAAIHLSQAELAANERIKLLESRLAENDKNHEEALKTCQINADARYIELETQLQLSRDKESELLKRLSEFSVTENQLRDKVLASENEFANRLQAAATRERELTEKLNQLNRQLEKSDLRCSELNQRSTLLQNEINVMRQNRNGGDAANLTLTSSNLSYTGTAANQSQMLQDEVESLRCVLELKQSEIAELRKQNHELQSAHDELPKALLKISSLESRIEDITIQFQAKIDEEKDLYQKNRSLQESYHQEIKNRNRLSLHNEELQWKLKQNSEKFTTALNELSRSYQDQSGFLSDCKKSLYGPLLETSYESSLDKTECFQMDDLSPPTSPVIKGVVEKIDSVSWVLEINDDESPEALASRMVKRAGSFRANVNERSPSFKRQLSLNANALSQSASATAILRQHSESPNHIQTIKQQKSPRNRSQSLTTNIESKQVIRSASGDMPSEYIKWKEPLSSSSPFVRVRKNVHEANTKETPFAKSGESSASKKSRVRSTSMSTELDDVEETKSIKTFNRNHASGSKQGLITCDTSALSSPRNELCPTLPAVQKLKKCQQIKESAGEAMISGTISDDDASFESGSDVDSISVTSSTTSPSHSEVNKRHNLSIDEEALMHKIVASLNSTPMEVSWSEDGDNEHYPHESSA